MFYHCDNIVTIDFKNLDLSNTSTLPRMFHWDSKLKSVYVKQIPTFKAGADTSYMWPTGGLNHFTVKEYND